MVLTRDQDMNLSLAERAAVARRQGAGIFISLHGNGGADRRGAETYVHPRGSAASRALAAAIHGELSPEEDRYFQTRKP